MRAAVTQSRGVMEVVDRPEPDGPGAGEVLVRPEAIGLCGSDFHYFHGDIGTIEDPKALYPRVQGHEVAGIVEAVGAGCRPGLSVGDRVAIWPLSACGRCYPCSIGRENVCPNLQLIGVHADGALQEHLRVPQTQVFAVGDEDPEIAAFIEPMSIAVRTVGRARIAAGERVVVLGAGPIGHSVAIAALDRGASVLVLDRLESRLERGASSGAEHAVIAPGEDVAARAHAWAGGDGPEVVVEATGVPALVDTALASVTPAGRVVVVGLSSEPASLRVGMLPFRELDLLGVSCCNAAEFGEAVALVARRRDVVRELITHRFSLDEAPEAIAYAIDNPAEVMKAVVRVS